MTISIKILDELLSGVDRPDDLLGDTGLIEGAEGALDGAHVRGRDDRTSGL